jgi:hypothetical protein
MTNGHDLARLVLGIGLMMAAVPVCVVAYRVGKVRREEQARFRRMLRDLLAGLERERVARGGRGND